MYSGRTQRPKDWDTQFQEKLFFWLLGLYVYDHCAPAVVHSAFTVPKGKHAQLQLQIWAATEAHYWAHYIINSFDFNTFEQL